LSTELNYNVMYSPRGVMMRAQNFRIEVWRSVATYVKRY